MSNFDAVIDRYEQRARKEYARLATLAPAEIPAVLDDMLLYVGPEVGNLMAALVRATGSKHIVELGTSYGYSTLWLASAAKDVGGKVVTVESSQKKQDFAREQLREVGLEDYVDFRCGDVLQIIPTLADNMNFVLLDVWKEVYIPCFDALRPKMAPGGTIVADNILLPVIHRPLAQAYQDHVRAVPGIESMLLSIGEGIEISCFPTENQAG